MPRRSGFASAHAGDAGETDLLHRSQLQLCHFRLCKGVLVAKILGPSEGNVADDLVKAQSFKSAS